MPLTNGAQCSGHCLRTQRAQQVREEVSGCEHACVLSGSREGTSEDRQVGWGADDRDTGRSPHRAPTGVPSR